MCLSVCPSVAWLILAVKLMTHNTEINAETSVGKPAPFLMNKYNLFYRIVSYRIVMIATILYGEIKTFICRHLIVLFDYRFVNDDVFCNIDHLV